MLNLVEVKDVRGLNNEMVKFILFCIVVFGGMYLLCHLCVWIIGISRDFGVVFMVSIFFVLVMVLLYLLFNLVGGVPS